jgi:hypothetical protein
MNVHETEELVTERSEGASEKTVTAEDIKTLDPEKSRAARPELWADVGADGETGYNAEAEGCEVAAGTEPGPAPTDVK